MKISNNYTGIRSFCINKKLVGTSLYIFYVYYFLLRNEFADKTLEKILRLEKSKKKKVSWTTARVLVLQD